MNRDIDNELYAIWLAKEVKDLTINKTSKTELGKSKSLPISCFLWIGDKSKRSTWHLPYRSGTGKLVNGIYENAGPVSLTILKAIDIAMSNSYPGAVQAPSQIRNKIKKILSQYNIKEYKGGGMNEKQKFTMVEAVISGQFKEYKIDTKKRVVENVAIMRQSTANIYIPGSTGTAFTENFRRQVALTLAGTKAYADHTSQWKKEDTGGVRSVRDLVGYYENGQLDSEGIVRGDLHYLSSVSDWFEPLIDEMSDKIGLSIDASGTMAFNPETGLAEALDLTKLKSVDVVTEPGSTVNIFESEKTEETIEDEEEEEMDLKTLTLADLKESRSDLFEAIKKSVLDEVSVKDEVGKLNTKIEELTESNKSYKAKLDEYEVAEKLAEKTEAVDALIKESEIPEEGITPVFREQLMDAKDESARKALIEDRKLLMESRKPTKIKSTVHGMGDSQEEDVTETMDEIKADFKEAMEG